MTRRTGAAAAVVISLSLIGCGEESTKPGPPPPAGYLLVLNSLGETFSRIDLTTGHVEDNVAPVGNAPNDLWIDTLRQRVWVANSLDNEVTGYDLATLERAAGVPLGPNSNPWNLIGTPDNRILVTNWLGGDVALIDPVAGTVVSRAEVGRTPEALLAGSTAFNFTVSLVNYDAPSGRYGPGQVLTYCPVCVRPALPLVTVGLNPQCLITGPDERIHVICTGNYGAYEPAEWGTVRILDAAAPGGQDTLRLGGTPAQAQVVGDMVYVSAYFGGLMKYNGRTHEVLRDSLHPISSAPGLSGMTVDEARQRLYVAGFEDDTIYVFDTAADTLVASWPVGDGPVALARVEAPETVR